MTADSATLKLDNQKNGLKLSRDLADAQGTYTPGRTNVFSVKTYCLKLLMYHIITKANNITMTFAQTIPTGNNTPFEELPSPMTEFTIALAR